MQLQNSWKMLEWNKIKYLWFASKYSLHYVTNTSYSKSYEGIRDYKKGERVEPVVSSITIDLIQTN